MYSNRLALIRGTRLGPYEITAQIGEGGMGQTGHLVYAVGDVRDAAPFDVEGLVVMGGDVRRRRQHRGVREEGPSVIVVQHWFEELRQRVPVP